MTAAMILRNDNMPRHNPRPASKAEFARRLYKLLLEKGWTQSDLARKARLPRDSISTYVRGVAFPSKLSLDKLAKALGVKTEELTPAGVEVMDARVRSSIEIKAADGHPGMAWIKVDQMCSFKAALQIAEILNNDEASDARQAVN